MNEPIKLAEAYLGTVRAKPNRDGILECTVSFTFDVAHGAENQIGQLARLLRSQVAITVEAPQLSFEQAFRDVLASAPDGATVEIDGRRVAVGTGEVLA